MRRIGIRVAVSLLLFMMVLPMADSVNGMAASMPDSEKLERIGVYVKEQFQLGGFPGGSYAIVADGRTVLAEGIGLSDKELKREATPDTMYAVASVTKALTASAVIQLADQGKVDLNAPVKSYLTWFRYQDEQLSSKVTVRHLLTHSAGVNRFTADGAIYQNIANNRNSVENALKTLTTVKMNSVPGAKGQYCNTCYNALGLIIQEVTGQPYESYIREHLLEPLGMTHTAYDPRAITEADIAKEYGYLFGFSKSFAPYWKAFGKSQAPGGGMYSSAADLARFLSALLGFEGSSVVRSYTWEPYTREGVAASDLEGVVYTASGFAEKEIAATRVLYKGGDGMGSTGAVALIPSHNYGVVLLIGESNSERRQAIMEGIVQILLGQPPNTVEKVVNPMQLLGYISLGFVAASLLLMIWIARNGVKIVQHKIQSVHRWLVLSRMCLFAALSVPLWYLLIVVRPAESGFYGFPYDLAIGMIALAGSMTIGILYSGALLIMSRRRESSINTV